MLKKNNIIKAFCIFYALFLVFFPMITKSNSLMPKTPKETQSWGHRLVSYSKIVDNIEKDQTIYLERNGNDTNYDNTCPITFNEAINLIPDKKGLYYYDDFDGPPNDDFITHEEAGVAITITHTEVLVSTKNDSFVISIHLYGSKKTTGSGGSGIGDEPSPYHPYYGPSPFPGHLGSAISFLLSSMISNGTIWFILAGVIIIIVAIVIAVKNRKTKNNVN